MDVKIVDFNGAQGVMESKFASHWSQLQQALERLPLQLKASDQAGKQGAPIFDPVGTNAIIKREMVAKGWTPNPPIPDELAFLGTDVDFIHQGLLTESQFSNYPFLLNNTVRSELFNKSGAVIGASHVEAAVIITKTGMLPASNSTLYFEQAERQLKALTKYKVFELPIRLVGLTVPTGNIEVTFNEYAQARYSRDLLSAHRCTATVVRAGRNDSRFDVVVRR
jgi:hypothetical protein